MKNLDKRIQELFRRLDDRQKIEFLNAFESRLTQEPAAHNASSSRFRSSKRDEQNALRNDAEERKEQWAQSTGSNQGMEK